LFGILALFPNLHPTTPKDDGGDESDAITLMMPKRHGPPA
jgi:hypothetical protein